jgi:hypothetical protein
MIPFCLMSQFQYSNEKWFSEDHFHSEEKSKQDQILAK